MPKAIGLAETVSKVERNTPAIGVFIPGDPRIDQASRERCLNIVEMTANMLADCVKLPDGSPARVVW